MILLVMNRPILIISKLLGVYEACCLQSTMNLDYPCHEDMLKVQQYLSDITIV